LSNQKNWTTEVWFLGADEKEGQPLRIGLTNDEISDYYKVFFAAMSSEK
jgi:hypothetical protein